MAHANAPLCGRDTESLLIRPTVGSPDPPPPSHPAHHPSTAASRASHRSKLDSRSKFVAKTLVEPNRHVFLSPMGVADDKNWNLVAVVSCDSIIHLFVKFLSCFG